MAILTDLKKKWALKFIKGLKNKKGMVRKMTKEKLAELNIGDNLDQLMNLDPRGYGVCRILYAGSRAYTGEPLTMHAAKEVIKNVQAG